MFLPVFSLVLLSSVVSEPAKTCGVTVVVLGSSGDLAKRYVWPALFENFQTFSDPSTECGISGLYAAVRKPVDNEREHLDRITCNVGCNNVSGMSDCSEKLALFRGSIHVVQLDHAESYASLAVTINYLHSLNGIEEVGRIFHLAVPPFAFPSIAKKISDHLRPVPKQSWIRVILEKPFGHDIHSASKLLEDIMQFLTSDELYLIDHYLGKVGVQGILSFRERNSKVLESLWNRNGIQNIEIAMKERVGVEGRSLFYDKYGVICDVMQNHLTELLVLVAVNIQHTWNRTADYLSSKNDLLSRVYPPSLQNTLLGQYSAYLTHLERDGISYNAGNESLTPTFAAVALHMRDPDWIGIPFLLISGKQLDVRSAYVRIVFTKTHFTLVGSGKECASSIVFLIQSEAFMQPGVLVSKDLQHLPLVSPTDNWLQEEVVYEECPYMFLHPQGEVSSNAYVCLLKDVLDGNKQRFVDITSLLFSWKVWSPLLSEIQVKKPVIHLYDPTSLDALAFRLNGTQMTPLLQTHMERDTILLTVSNATQEGQYSIDVVSDAPVIISNKVARYISGLAKETVREKGSFHVAFPGGSSLLGLFQSLVLDYQHAIPWRHTHIWQTDERCVNKNDSQSNFLQLSNHLLSLVPVPLINMHPMPVLLHSGYCVHIDGGMELYEREIEHHTRGKMDLVLLGLGEDGHIASIFPKVAVEKEIGNGVRIEQLVSSYPVHVRTRMSLSLETILGSKRILLMVAGKGKEAIYNTLLDCIEGSLDSVEFDLPVIELATRVQYNQMIIYHLLP